MTKRILCFFIGHDEEVDDRLHGETTRLRCRRCHREKTIPVCEQNLNPIETTLANKKGVIHLGFVELGENILVMKYSLEDAVKLHKQLSNAIMESTK